MKYGISFLPDCAPQVKSAAEYFSDALELSRLAEDCGLSFVKMTEHYLHPYGGYCPSPLAFLAAVAARTSRIRLMSGGVLASLHQPLQIASEASMLDAISGGRAEIGLARAYLPYEFEAFDVPLDESRERFEATVQAIIELWRGTSLRAASGHTPHRGLRALPVCTQVPHPPVWVTAVQSRQSFAWIGEHQFGLLTTPRPAGAGALAELVDIYDKSLPSGPDAVRRVAVSLPMFLHQDDSLARQEGCRYLNRYLDVWRDAARAWDSKTSAAYPGYTGMGKALASDSGEAMCAREGALIGSPGRVVDAIGRLMQEIRPTHLLWMVDFGAMPIEPARRTLELFESAVKPQVAG